MSKLFRQAGPRLRAMMICGWFLLGATAFGADDYSQWTHSSAVFLNTTASGANVTGTVANFPIVLKLTSSNFSGFGQAKAGGADIRFSKSDGTHLPYQIERWDAANQLAEIWVKVDQILGNNSSQYIKMYWGNSSAGDSSRPQAVFDTANGFQAAWHLGEAGTGNTYDATINNYTGISSGATKPAETVGIIGRAKNFNGAATALSYFDVTGSGAGSSKLNFPQAGTYTISAWVNTNNVGDGLYHDFLAKGDHQYSVDVNTGSFWQFGEFQNNVGWNSVASLAAATAGTWAYITAIRNGAAMNLFVNGALVNSTVQPYAKVTPRIETFDVSIGWNLDTAGFGGTTSGNHFFNGKIDELVLANKVRSTDWIKLCYENQRPGTTMSSFAYAPANLTYSTNPASYVTGTAITANSPTSSGGAVVSYLVVPALPSGLALNATTGVITGIPTIATAAANYTVTATNVAGSATVALSITVIAALTPPANLKYSTNPAAYPTGTAIASNTPTSSGGAVASYLVAPALPAGLTLSATTGVITGTPTTAQVAATYTVTATNAVGSTTASLSITVNASLAPPSNLIYSMNPASCVVGTAIASNTPTSSGGAVASYSVAPALPAGLTLNTATGVITGTPTVATAAAIYTVTATNATGSTTASLSITVVPAQPKANFKASAVTGKIPLSVTFTDSSIGVVSKRYWYFGDNPAPDSAISPAHTYVTEGNFTAKLVVFDWSGRRADSMTAMVRTYKDNPVLISGRLVPPGSVEITYDNYGVLPTGPLPPFADSIALWYKPGAIPLSGTGATYAKTYIPAAMQSSGKGAPIKDVIAIPQPFTDSVYGFITAVHWTDGTWSKFATGNGCLVLVKDTSTPVNTCVIRGKYLGTENAALVVDSMKTIDMSSIDSLGVWYGSLSTDTVPNFGDALSSKWYGIQDLATVITATGKDSIVIVNPQYNTGLVKTVWCAMILKGKNGRYSSIKKASFSVGVNRPVNPMVLTASGPTATKIDLSWPAVTGVESIRIVYRAGGAVPVNTYYFDPAQYKDTVVAVTAVGVTITGLAYLTHYYFGAQVYKGGLWSVVTQNSSADAVTTDPGAALDSNRIIIAHPVFNSVKNQIRVSWTVPMKAGDPHEVGISYSTGGYPTSEPAGMQVVLVTAVKDSAVVQLHENLVFNAAYYIALWERRVDGKWTAPTAASQDTVTTPDFNWQPVTYFTKVPGDTAYAFNNFIRLMTDSVTDPSFTTDTVVIFKPDPSLLAGFIQASIAFKFAQPQSTAPFYIGLRFAALPGTYSANNLRVYRFHDSVWTVESTMVVDAQAGYVSVKTRNLGDPFMVMLDTMAATVTAEAHSRVVSEFADLRDTFTVSDNVANVKWQFMCAMGGVAYSAGSITGNTLGYTRSGQVYTTIPYSYVTGDNGVRARLIVSDGVHTTVCDVSRQVRRSNSDYVRTEPKKWEPLRVTSALDTAEVRHALRAMDDAAKPWQYDTKKVRLFKWYPNAQNALLDQKWVEYSDDVAALFGFQPGGLIWIKTLDETALNFGGGVTLPLDSLYSIPIAANAWTDMALPFKFNIKVGDIIDATAAGTLNADSLVIYSWERDPAGRFVSQPVYNARFGIGSKSVSLGCLDMTGYTIRNLMANEPITLRVPAIPEAMSRYGQGLVKRSGTGGWAMKVQGGLSNGSRMTDVYCVYDPTTGGSMQYFPLSPTFGQLYVGVYDAKQKKTFGHAMTGVTTNGGCAYKLAFVNESQAGECISYRCEPTVPMAGVQAKIYNEESGKYEGLEASVNVPPGGTQYRWLFVGNAGYLAKAPVMNASILGLIGTSPNPFRGAVRIRYSLPPSGIGAVKFTICDLRGVVVLRQTVGCHGRSGAGELTWNAGTQGGHAAAAGIYVLKMSAFDVKGKQAGVFEQKMTLLP